VRVTEEGVPIQDLIQSVKHAIQDANISSADADRDLRVGSVHLILHAVATRSLGGRVEFCIPFIGMTVKLGKKVTTQDTHRIEIGLAPPDVASGREVREGDIDSVLADAISTIRTTVASAAEEPDPFTLTDSCVEISFAVTAEGAISLGVDGGLTDELTHTLTLKLTPVRRTARSLCDQRERAMPTTGALRRERSVRMVAFSWAAHIRTSLALPCHIKGPPR